MTALTTAKISSRIEDAALILRRALGLAPGTGDDLLPEQADWRRMDDSQRLIALGEWLKSVCYQQADIKNPPQVFEPIGGAKYAHQND
jgi:hypothetical protein